MKQATGVNKWTQTLAAVAIALVVGAAVVTTQQAGTRTGGVPLDPNTRDQNRRTRFTPMNTSVDLEANAASARPTGSP